MRPTLLGGASACYFAGASECIRKVHCDRKHAVRGRTQLYRLPVAQRGSRKYDVILELVHNCLCRRHALDRVQRDAPCERTGCKKLLCDRCRIASIVARATLHVSIVRVVVVVHAIQKGCLKATARGTAAVQHVNASNFVEFFELQSFKTGVEST